MRFYEVGIVQTECDQFTKAATGEKNPLTEPVTVLVTSGQGPTTAVSGRYLWQPSIYCDVHASVDTTLYSWIYAYIPHMHLSLQVGMLRYVMRNYFTLLYW